MKDPFATEPEQDAPSETEATVTPPEPEQQVELVTTLKGGSAFSDPWVVVHATGVDAITQSVRLLGAEMAAYLKHVKKVASFFVAEGAAEAPSPEGQLVPRPARQAAPQGATEAPAWAPAKPYEDFVYKTGVSKKNGKTWHAWMPPEQGDQRPAKFFYAN